MGEKLFLTILFILWLFFYTGEVSCTFTFVKGVTRTDTAQLYVIPKPRVRIDPLSLTIQEEEVFTLTCSAFVPGTDHPGNLTFTWFRWNGIADEDISNNPGSSE